MKRLILVLALAALPAFAQDAGGGPTSLSAFADQRGVVVIEGFTKMGTITAAKGGTLAVAAEDFKNAATGVRRQGLAFIVSEGTGRRCISYVDDEEIAPLLSGLETLDKLDVNATPLALFRASYRTAGDLGFVVVNSRNVKDLKLSITSGVETPCSVLMNLVMTDEILSQVREAKKLLDSIR